MNKNFLSLLVNIFESFPIDLSVISISVNSDANNIIFAFDLIKDITPGKASFKSTMFSNISLVNLVTSIVCLSFLFGPKLSNI